MEAKRAAEAAAAAKAQAERDAGKSEEQLASERLARDIEAEAEAMPVTNPDGGLHVTVVHADFNKDGDLIGKMDPYVVLWLEQAHPAGTKRKPRNRSKAKEEQRDTAATRAVNGGGKHVDFHADRDHARLRVQLDGLSVIGADPERVVLQVEAWDDDLLGTSFVGAGVLELGPVVQPEDVTEGKHSMRELVVELFAKDGRTPAGQVLLQVKYVPGEVFQDNSDATAKRSALALEQANAIMDRAHDAAVGSTDGKASESVAAQDEGSGQHVDSHDGASSPQQRQQEANEEKVANGEEKSTQPGGKEEGHEGTEVSSEVEVHEGKESPRSGEAASAGVEGKDGGVELDGGATASTPSPADTGDRGAVGAPDATTEAAEVAEQEAAVAAATAAEAAAAWAVVADASAEEKAQTPSDKAGDQGSQATDAGGDSGVSIDDANAATPVTVDGDDGGGTSTEVGAVVAVGTADGVTEHGTPSEADVAVAEGAATAAPGELLEGDAVEAKLDAGSTTSVQEGEPGTQQLDAAGDNVVVPAGTNEAASQPVQPAAAVDSQPDDAQAAPEPSEQPEVADESSAPALADAGKPSDAAIPDDGA